MSYKQQVNKPDNYAGQGFIDWLLNPMNKEWYKSSWHHYGEGILNAIQYYLIMVVPDGWERYYLPNKELIHWAHGNGRCSNCDGD